MAGGYEDAIGSRQSFPKKKNNKFIVGTTDIHWEGCRAMIRTWTAGQDLNPGTPVQIPLLSDSDDENIFICPPEG
jgi:hypothetical protein